MPSWLIPEEEKSEILEEGMTLRGGGDNNKKKKSFIPKLFSTRDKKKDSRNPYENSSSQYERCQTFPANASVANRSYPAIPSASMFRNLSFTDFASPMTNVFETESFRVFVATWNVGGKTPQAGMNLDDFLQVEYQADIYVLGFQEIVPLNAGNVLVIEDNEPAAKWLTLINQALNTPGVNGVNNPSTSSDYNFSFSQSSRPKASTPRDSKNKLFFQKPSLKTFSKNFRTVKRRWLKTCNCTPESERKYIKESCFCISPVFFDHTLFFCRIYDLSICGSSPFLGVEELPHLQQWLGVTLAGAVELGRIVDPPLIHTATSVKKPKANRFLLSKLGN